MDNLSQLYRESYRRSELRIEAQVTAALAADARAINFAGLTIATAAILCGLSINSSLQFFLLFGSATLVISSMVAANSAKPITFMMQGAKFSDLDEDFEKNEPIDNVIRQLGGFCDLNIDENNKVLNSNANQFRHSQYLAFVGLMIAIFPHFILLFFTGNAT